MRIDVTIDPSSTLPAPRGAHELAWSYILDEIFADAYSRGLSEMHIVLPHIELQVEVMIRAELTPAGSSRARGLALLAGGHAPCGAGDAVYGMWLGYLAPRGPRNAYQTGSPPGTHHRLSVYTWQAFALGIPMRLGSALGRPRLVDAATFAMRRTFASERFVPAYYHLWSSAANGH